MPGRKFPWSSAFIAIAMLLGVALSSFAGSLESAGAIPHDLAAQTVGTPFSPEAPLESDHHHHLADLNLPPCTRWAGPVVSTTIHIPAPAPLASDAPTTGIERPPQLP